MIDFTFITQDDLETRVFEDYIDDSVQEDIDAALSIEKQAIAFVKSKLRKRYNVAIIFGADPYPEKNLIIWAISGIVSYRLVKRNAARKVPSDFREDYKEVMDWLNDVRDGNENPDLPLIETEEQKEVLWGNSKNEDYYL